VRFEPGSRVGRVTRFEAMVEVSLRQGIADPQGATIERALPALGFDSVSGVRCGKAFRFVVEAVDQAAARVLVEDLCHRLLTNPVIEDSLATLAPVDEPAVAGDGAAVAGDEPADVPGAGT
jgi:phosphoribosylformylglycinamidine synthase subunit PurS